MPAKPAKTTTQPKVALVYDRVNTPYGGAENVLLALHSIYPEAPLYTSVYNPDKAPWANVFTVVPSFLQYLPWARTHHQWLAALMPLAFESFDFSGYDIIISITSAEGKGVITSPTQLHLCYLLTPPRYLYHYRRSYEQEKWFFKMPILRSFALALLDYLTWWDRVAHERPDIIVPIAQRVKEQAESIYGKSIEQPLYPPVKEELAQPALFTALPAQLQPILAKQQPFCLVLSRLVSYKRIDLAIQACQQVALPLVIVGSGVDSAPLKQLATSSTSPIIFLDNQPDSTVSTLLQHCLALLMPGEEDFGITALEANLAGKPVIINHLSGAAEVITSQKHGLHLSNPTAAELASLINQLKTLSFNSDSLVKNARKYGTSNFVQDFAALVNRAWQAHEKDKQVLAKENV